MRPQLTLLTAAICLCGTIAAAAEQDLENDQEVPNGVALVAAVTGNIGAAQIYGAGIVFAIEKDRVYIVTANHVVRQGATEAAGLQVRLRNWPDKTLAAKLLPRADRQLDVAVLTVDNLAASGIDACTLSLDRLAPEEAVERGVSVFPIGNPNGVAWGVPLHADGILEVQGDEVTFESLRIARGHSGGALIGAGGRLFGMIQADEPPNGRAIGMGALVRVLKGWGLPVHLAVGSLLRRDDYHHFGQLSNAVLADDLRGTQELLGQVCTNVKQEYEGRILSAAKSAAIVDLLVSAGADVNPKGAGEPPIEAAAQYGRPEVAKALIAHGADVNWNGYRSYASPLSVAVAFGQLEIVKLLLASGANPNLGDERRPPPLMVKLAPTLTNRSLALRDEILRALIASRADVNWKDDRGDTPLTVAVEAKDETAVRILLEAGAFPDAKDGRVSAIHGPAHELGRNTIDSGHSLERIVTMLLAHSSTIAAEDALDLLGRAAREGWGGMANQIAGLGFKFKGPESYEILREAARNGHASVVRPLLAMGADPNADGKHWMPLELALDTKLDQAARFDVVQLLVTNGARVNFRPNEPNWEYQEPVYRAVIDLGDLKLARFLVAHGAKVTPHMIEMAKQRRKTEAAAMFEQLALPTAPDKK